MLVSLKVTLLYPEVEAFEHVSCSHVMQATYVTLPSVLHNHLHQFKLICVQVIPEVSRDVMRLMTSRACAMSSGRVCAQVNGCLSMVQ